MLAKKPPFTCCPAAKHQKHNQLAATNIREKTVDFLNFTARASTLAPAIILRTLVPLQVSVPVGSIIP